jgi:3'-phosphoadenosine 5'-phosphosulfate sulfotransferase (PAPS reductase)/FAD synthetase|uniref:Adenine nucleotide alpha hydrolase n=1 Tax=Yangshan Harbor Nitrososphaeria virus TaxID=2969597 RepID=A0A976YE64_9CAUD|nr:adenine nucleotide alpha hydrolase [Yangshan Harbor Nitrososphaeria virus]
MKLSKNYRGGHSMKLEGWEVKAEIAKPYEQKLEETKEMIRVHLDNFKRPQVATSWGKDSTVLSALICDICLNERKMNPRTYSFPVFTLAHTRNIYKEEPEYWEYIRLKLGIPKVKFMIFYPEDDEGNPKTVWSIAKDVGHLPSFRRVDKPEIDWRFRHEPECCYQLKRESVNRFLKKQSRKKRWDLVFVGTRAEESRARRFSVMMNCRTYSSRYHRPYVSRTCTPLSFWTDSDIERYLKDNDIKKCPVYKIHNQERMGCASCPAHVGWEKRLTEDPTESGKGMFKMNMRILRVTQPNRFWNSLSRVKDLDLVNDILDEPEDEGWRKDISYDEKLMKKAKKFREEILKKREGGEGKKCLNGKCSADTFW